MSLTLAAAAAAAGENKTTLLRANKAGKVSGNKDEHSPVVYRTRQTPPRLSAGDAARPQRSAALSRDGCARGRDRQPASSRGTLARPAVAQKCETSSLPIRLTSQACRVLCPGKRKPVFLRHRTVRRPRDPSKFVQREGDKRPDRRHEDGRRRRHRQHPSQ